jgi:hypothetical protein
MVYRSEFKLPSKFTITRDLAYIFQYNVLIIGVVRTATPNHFRLGKVVCSISNPIQIWVFSLKKTDIHLSSKLAKVIEYDNSCNQAYND